MKVYEIKDSDDKLFLTLWYKASKGLFSDESRSLRGVDKLLKAFHETDMLNNIMALKEWLYFKLPRLGDYCCRKFSEIIYEIFKKMKENKIKEIKNNLPETNDSPLKILVEVSLAAKEEQMSYPEFISHMKNAYQLHPVIRLASWVISVYQSYQKKTPEVVLESLRKLDVIDQIGFPFIKTEINDNDLSVCDTFSKKGVFYSDILWLAEAAQHGFNFNWKEASKEWKKNFITKASDFSYLLSVCAV